MYFYCDLLEIYNSMNHTHEEEKHIKFPFELILNFPKFV